MQPRIAIIESDDGARRATVDLCSDYGWQPEGYPSLAGFFERESGDEPDVLLYSVPDAWRERVQEHAVARLEHPCDGPHPVS